VPPKLGLYVHIPFCSVKCFYCDFASFAGRKDVAARYLNALKTEVALLGSRQPETLYIGGGTPSELEAGEIERLFSLIHEAYPESRFVETTFEANPESLSAEKLEVLKRWGVSRISLGLQTTDDTLLKSIGRRHSREDFFSIFRLARAAGDWAISVDLMYGLPGQSPESHRCSLEEVLALDPEHLSLYGLHVEDKTVFGRKGFETDEDAGREMYETSLELIDKAGLARYELSNFARPRFESLHNAIYWRDGEYIGLGCGAASHLDGVRSANVPALIPYCVKVEGGSRPIIEQERLSGKEKLGEKILLGLRLAEGIDLEGPVKREFSREWSELEDMCLVERAGPRVRLSREGVFLANEVFCRFVAPFAESAQ